MFTKKNLPKSFDFINHQWQLFLQRVKLEESKMPEIQRIEMKRAFIAGAGQMLVCMRDDVSVYPEHQGVQILQSMLDSMGDFWQNEQLRHDGKLN